VVEFLVPEIQGVKVINELLGPLREGRVLGGHASFKGPISTGERSIFENFAKSVSIKDLAAIARPLEKEPDSIVPREFKVAGHGALVIDVPRSGAIT